MSTRSKELAQAFKAQKERVRCAAEEQEARDRIKNEKVLRNDKVLVLKGPKTWESFCQSFADQAAEFNAEFGIGNILEVVSQSNTLTLARTDGYPRKLHLVFDPLRYTVTFSGMYIDTEEFRIKVLNGDSDLSVVAKDGRSVDVGGTVEIHIRRLLGLEN
jgi:hypothetical protein